MFATPRGRWAVVLACALVGPFSACDSATDPRPTEPVVPRLTVQIAAATTSAAFRLQGDYPHVECRVQLTATAAGDAGAYATWEDGRLTWLGGPDGRSVLRVRTVTADSLHQAMFADRIAVGQTQTGELIVQADLPFTVRGEFRYRVEGSEKLSTVVFESACQAGRAYAGGAEPRIRDIFIEPGTDVIQPGPDVWFSVIYTAMAADGGVGLRETGVRLSGGLATSVSRPSTDPMARVSTTVPFAVSTTAEIGQRIRFQVYSVDAEGREVATDWIDGPMVVDSTPPGIYQGYFPGSDPERAAARYATSDSLRIRLWAGDNHRLSHLVYTLGGPVNVRDSLPITLLTSVVTIPIQEAWEGAESFSMLVRDVAGNSSNEIHSPPGEFQLYPERPRTTRSVEVDGAYSDAILDPAGDRLFLAQPEAQSVTIVPLDDLSDAMRVRFEGRPMPVSLDLSPDGGSLVVALRSARALAFLNSADLSLPPLLRSLDLFGSDYGPAAARYLPDGRVMVEMSGVKDSRFVEVDPATGEQRARPEVFPFIAPLYAPAVRTPDYERIGFDLDNQCVLVYDAGPDEFTACNDLIYGASLSVSDDGSRFARAYGVYDASLRPLRMFMPPFYGSETAGISADGTELFRSHERGLLRIRVQDGLILDRTPLAPVYNGRILPARARGALVVVGREPEYNADRTAIHLIQMN